MSALKRLALGLIGAGGVFHLGKHLRRHSLAVLTYHHVSAAAESPLGGVQANSVSAKDFDRQVGHLSRHYRVIGGDEFRNALEGNITLKPNSVLITFDDGYRDNYEAAFPVLRKYGATAVFFVTTDFLDDPTRLLWFERLDQLLVALPTSRLTTWVRGKRLAPHLSQRRHLRAWFKGRTRDERSQLLDELEQLALKRPAPGHHTAPMTWTQAREMADAGMTFGAHTVSHQILSAESEENVCRELTCSRERVERELGRSCWCFSYPNGEPHDFRTSDIAAVERSGFLCALTQIPGFVTSASHPYRLPRIPVPATDDFNVFLSRVSGVHDAVRALTRRSLASPWP